MKKHKFLTWAAIVLISISLLVYLNWDVGIFNPDVQKIDHSPVSNVETDKSTQKLNPSQVTTSESVLNTKLFVSKDCNDCAEMILIPAGSYEMGEKGHSHHVTIGKQFAIGKYEVTQAQWQAIMGNNPSHFRNCGSNCPVDNVSWDDIQLFIHRLNKKTGKRYRLPSESEWEYACRSGGSNKYCGSDNVSTVSWNGGTQTHSVGLKQPNAFGLYDMSGNVWEWVEDTWHENFTGAPTNGAAWSGSTSYHVLRGGAWFSMSEAVSASYRGRSIPPVADAGFGFRLAKSL